MLVSTLAFFAAVALTSDDKVEVKIKNVSAQYVLDALNSRWPIFGFMNYGAPETIVFPETTTHNGVKLELGATGSSIVISGPLSRVREIEQRILLLDVAPEPVEFSLEAVSFNPDRSMAASMTILSNSGSKFVDSWSHIEISVHPRINNDRSITLHYILGAEGQEATGALRFRSGDYVYARIYSGEKVDEETGRKKRALLFDQHTTAEELDSFFTVDDPFKDIPRIRLYHRAIGRNFYTDNLASDIRVANPPDGVDVRLKMKIAFAPTGKPTSSTRRN